MVKYDYYPCDIWLEFLDANNDKRNFSEASLICKHSKHFKYFEAYFIHEISPKFGSESCALPT